mgnify:CR=1 FL=1
MLYSPIHIGIQSSQERRWQARGSECAIPNGDFEPRESGFSEGLALEPELQQRVFESEDAKEGLRANLEKRKPSFEGR